MTNKNPSAPAPTGSLLSCKLGQRLFGDHARLGRGVAAQDFFEITSEAIQCIAPRISWFTTSP